MRWLRARYVPFSLPSRGARLSAVTACALVVAGCAGPSAERSSTLQAQVHRMQMEDDGLPRQTPPPPRVRGEPDDPSEPFSPNYGARLKSAAVGSLARMSSAEEDAIIARAIAAHETRHP